MIPFLLQLEDLRQRLKDLEDKEKKENKKMADEDALRKIRAVEEQIEYLQKKLAMAKQVGTLFKISFLSKCYLTGKLLIAKFSLSFPSL